MQRATHPAGLEADSGVCGSRTFARCLVAAAPTADRLFAPHTLQGHVYRSSTGKLERWFKPDWISLEHIPTPPVDYPQLKVRQGSRVGMAPAQQGAAGGGTAHAAASPLGKHGELETSQAGCGRRAAKRAQAVYVLRSCSCGLPTCLLPVPLVALPAANLHRRGGEAADV